MAKNIAHCFKILICISLFVCHTDFSGFEFPSLRPIHANTNAVITVNTSTQGFVNDGQCSLAEAIQAANTNMSVDACTAGAGDDVIELQTGQSYTFSSVDNNDSGPNGLPAITSTITINGNGASLGRNTSGPALRFLLVKFVPGYFTPTLTIRNITMTNGIGQNSGGAIYSYSPNSFGSNVVIEDSIFMTNTAIYGGAFSNTAGGSLIVRRSQFNNNIATNQGGALAITDGDFVVEDSGFAGNSTDTNGGAIFHSAAIGNNQISRSSFSGNSAGNRGGAVFLASTASTEIVNSTFQGNNAINNTTNNAYGGGIFAQGANVTVRNVTLTENEGSIGAGISINGGSVTLFNTINGGNWGDNCLVAGGGTLTAGADNIAFGDSTCNSARDVDPLLGPMQYNGGWTWTMIPGSGSPAIDSGTNATCAALDQRGATRPANSVCDVGAYEVNATFASSTSTPTSTSTSAAATSTPTATATNVPATSTPTATATNVPATSTPTATATNVPATNTPTATATNVPNIHLGVSLEDGATNVVAGEQLVYRIVVSNTGNATANEVQIESILPSEFNWSSIGFISNNSNISMPFHINANILTTATIGAQGVLTFTITGTLIANANGPLTHSVAITYLGAIADSGTQHEAIDINTVSRSFSIGLTKSDGETSVTPNQPITYTIILTNAGPSTAEDITVSDIYPAGFVVSQVGYSGRNARISNPIADGQGNLSNTITITPGGQITFTIVGNVAANASGILTNTIYLTIPTGLNVGGDVISATDADPVLGAPTMTPTPTATATNSPPTATSTASATATETATPTPTATDSPPTATSTASATATETATPTPTATDSPPTATPTASATATETATPTPTATDSPPTATPTASAIATETATPTPTATASATPTITATPTLTATPTKTSTPTVTPTPTAVVPFFGNQLWIETDGNGMFNAGEAPVVGHVLTATNSLGGVFTATTDINGQYRFVVPPGVYVVSYGNAPNNTVPSITPGGSTVNAASLDTQSHANNVIVTLGAAQQILAADFGFWRLASMGDAVWEDVNHNGQQDIGEPGLANVLVTLRVPAIGANPANEITTTTSVTGFYKFSGLMPFVPYTVTFNTPTDYQQTLKDVGGDSADNDGVTVVVTLAPNQQNTSIDSGFWRSASLGDLVWADNNNNGIQDAGETGVPNVTVKLYMGGIVISNTQTNASGNYRFTNLISGTYTASFMLPGGYVFGPQNVGADRGIDSDVNVATGSTAPFSLISGGNELDIDAGLYQLPQLNIAKEVTTQNGDGSGATVKPGDELTYKLIVKNTGNTVATGIVVTDPLDSPAVEYVAGSAVPAPTSQTNKRLVWHVGNLDAGQSKEIVFRVSILDVINAVTVITNVAQISGLESGTIVQSRNSNLVDNPFEPSIVTLASFTAAPQTDNNVYVRWVTTMEVDTWSFALYRATGSHSDNEIPADAEKITPKAILAQGRGGAGGSYEFVDTDATFGQVYTYWLVETETTGGANVYGPAKWGGIANTDIPSKIYLPMLSKK